MFQLIPKFLLSVRFLTLSLVLTSCVITEWTSQKNEKETVTSEDSVEIDETSQERVFAEERRKQELGKLCVNQLKNLPGDFRLENLESVCARVHHAPSCESFEGTPIYHYDKQGTSDSGQRILVLSLIHGDEIPSGSVARSWMARLHEISPRNTWRVLPMLNPDGVQKKSRLNSRNVDLNRNFPTQDWDELALKSWKELAASNPRRYPGPSPASEPETACAIEHIKDFKPDFIISIHTPLGVLDFDGPQSMPFPNFQPLPWQSLGHFPGSLGRYMWKEHGVPVLTVELKGDEVARRSLEAFDKLQDITGTVAIQAQDIIDQLGIERKTPQFDGNGPRGVTMEAPESEAVAN